MPHSRAAGGDLVWRPTRLALYARDGWRCAVCDWTPAGGDDLRTLTRRLRRGAAIEHTFLAGRSATWGLSLDHPTPPSRGGAAGSTGLVTMCVWCNSRKGTRTIREFAPRRRRRIGAQVRRERDRALGRALCALLYPGWLEAEAQRSADKHRRRQAGQLEGAIAFFDAIASGRAA